MMRYLVFGGMTYYPTGGWGEFMQEFDDKQEAIDYANKSNEDWRHVVDTVEKKIIHEVTSGVYD